MTQLGEITLTLTVRVGDIYVSIDHNSLATHDRLSSGVDRVLTSGVDELRVKWDNIQRGGTPNHD